MTEDVSPPTESLVALLSQASHGAAGGMGRPHKNPLEVPTADPVRSLAIVIEGRQSELVRVYDGMERRLEGRPGVRITAWVDGEPGSLSIAPKRPR